MQLSYFTLPPQSQGRTLYQADLITDQKVIALTFDDGPWQDTPQVLDVLKQHQAKATFFVLGKNLSQYSEIAQRVVKEGHVIGNHTWSHPQDRISLEAAAEEIDRTTAKIQELTGIKVQLFRPPYGITNNGVVDCAKQKNYMIVMWSIDSQDYRQPPGKILADQILTQVHPGAIVLLHDGGGERSQTVEALSIIIPQLKQQGYQFVTIPELLNIESQSKKRSVHLVQNHSDQDQKKRQPLQPDQQLVDQDKIQATIEQDRKRIKRNPKVNLRVYKRLASALIKQRLLEEAIEVCNLAIQRFPKNPTNYVLLGNIFTLQKRCEDAIKQYRKAFELDSNQPLPVYQKLGNQLFNISDIEAAEQVFQELAEKYPDYPQGYQGLARVAIHLQQLELAQKRWEKVIALFPDHIPAWMGLGNLFIEEGKLKEAEKVFKNISEKHPDHPQGYQGLVRLAIHSLEWELVLERANLAIRLFPDDLGFLLQKINALKQLFQFEDAKQVIQQAKLCFSNDFKLDLAEANLYQKQYDYQAARQILMAATLKYPDNIKVQIERANNYCQLSQQQAAKEVLTAIQSNIWSENIPLINQFTKLYVKLLLKDYQINDLIQYFDEARSHQVWNREMMINYHQLLMTQELYQDASENLEQIIAEKQSSITKYKENILLWFELEKIKNIQMILQSQSSFNEVNQIYTESISHVKSFLDDHPQFENLNQELLKIFNKINQLSRKCKAAYLNTDTSTVDTYKVALQIIHHIKNKIPLSLIRLGDGEGKFLDYEKEWQQFQEIDRTEMQQLWWGEVKIDRDEWQNLQGDYLSAIYNADIIGIPEFYRFCRSFKPQLTANHQSQDFRGLMTVINTLLQSNDIQISNISLTSCHLHHNLEYWGLYQVIFEQIKDCSLISCHGEVSQFLQRQYGVTVQKFYQIPSEYKYSQLFNYQDQENQPHYPDHFQYICSNLKVSYSGEVFLVAAVNFT